MTKQKKVLIKKGLAPIGKFQHTYQQLWLWGTFSLITGEAFYWETPIVNNLIFEDYLKAYSKINPQQLKIIIIDNAGFHSAKNIEIPKNIILLRIPPYCPELNPAEKIWQWMKDRTAMKFFDDIKSLQNKITKLVNQLDKDIVKSITAYEFYVKTFLLSF